MNYEEIKALEDLINPEEDLDISLVFSLLKGIKKVRETGNILIKYYNYNHILSTIFFNLFLESKKLGGNSSSIFRSASLDIEFRPSFFFNDVEVLRVDYCFNISSDNKYQYNDYINIVYKWPEKDIPNSTGLYTIFYVKGLGEEFIEYVIRNLMEKLVNKRNELGIRPSIY